MAGLSTIGSIATFLVATMSVADAISGNMVTIVDQARQYVANYTGDDIGSNSIDAKYQPAIIDFAKAEVISLCVTVTNASLGDLSVTEDQLPEAEQYRLMGELKLKALGRKIQFARSLS